MARTTMKAFRLAALALPALFGLASASFAQTPEDDNALDRLLEKVEPQKPDDSEGSTDESSKPDSASTDKPVPANPQDKPKPNSSEPEDKALDSLLEKFGEPEDVPQAKGKRAPGADPDDQPEPGEAGDGDSTNPTGAAQPKPSIRPGQEQIDEHLEELAGIRRRKKQQEKQDPQSGQIAQAIKKMREVEKRLGEKDTGDKTQERQKEIIKDLEHMIKQAQQAGQGSGSGRQKGVQQAGPPGSQPGSQPGNTGKGTGASTPKKPSAKSVLADNKDEWGHLPPEMRGEMENVFKEDALPGRKSLIDRYYISITRKSAGNRGE